jgi:uncharacterized ubiquitin-like protein YukD
MNAYLNIYQSDESGLAILGLYLNKKSAIRSAMRKAYQLMDIKAIKVKGEWIWADTRSVISVNEIKIADYKDLNGDSPIPQFLRYQEYLQNIPVEELEKIRNQSINRKKLLDKLKINKV